jgi:hypothetical protein
MIASYLSKSPTGVVIGSNTQNAVRLALARVVAVSGVGAVLGAFVVGDHKLKSIIVRLYKAPKGRGVRVRNSHGGAARYTGRESKTQFI